MVVAIMRDARSGKEFTGRAGRRMYLYAESTGTVSFSVPYAPQEISYGGLAQEWATAERTGDKPLLLRKGDNLATMKFSVRLVDVDRSVTQSPEIAAVRVLAKSRERVLVRYGSTEAGLWRITDVSITSLRRHPDNDEVTDATVDLTLTEASDAAPAVGPVAPPPPPPPPPKPPPPRTYRVVKGDCLWRIAQRYYGQGILWPRIFDANRTIVKNPHLIFPGQVFVIP